MYLQVLFGVFLAALVLLLLIFLFLPFPNQATKPQKQHLLPPKNHMQAPAPSMHLVSVFLILQELHNPPGLTNPTPFSSSLLHLHSNHFLFPGSLGHVGCWSLGMGKWMLGICSLLPRNLVGMVREKTARHIKGSEEQLGIGERRAIGAFRLCFLHLKLLSPSHTEGETTICLFVASLCSEVLEAGLQHLWPLLLILGMVMRTEQPWLTEGCLELLQAGRQNMTGQFKVTGMCDFSCQCCLSLTHPN